LPLGVTRRSASSWSRVSRRSERRPDLKSELRGLLARSPRPAGCEVVVQVRERVPAVARATLDPAGAFGRHPLKPHQLVDRVTRTEDTIVLCHLGVPRIDPDDWSLSVDGLVRRPMQLTLSEIKRRPRVEITSIHQCCGSPLKPRMPTRRICNVVWSGVRLSELIADCGPDPAARYPWSSGADHGVFEGDNCDAFVKDLPLDRVAADVLIAYEMNGEPLRPENGYPARLVVPGYYGTNSVKWLTRLTLADVRASGPFTTRWYNDPILDVEGKPTGATTPVGPIAPESVIVSPAPDHTLPIGGCRSLGLGLGGRWRERGRCERRRRRRLDACCHRAARRPRLATLRGDLAAQASPRVRALVSSPLRRRRPAAGRGGPQCDSSCADHGPVSLTRREAPGPIAIHAGRTHRSGRSPRFLRANSSSGEGFFLSTLSQSALFSAESSLSTHLSFPCSAAKTGTLASVAADRVRTRTIFVMIVFPDCSTAVCRQGSNIMG
jgi:DMSO/TMAO reductase YedYZ molybdopterin-dependent catalytic subunit